MKKILAIALMLMIMLASVSAMAEGAKIGVALNDADEFRTAWLDKFTTIAEANGHTVVSTNAGSDASKQISDIESLIMQQCDLVVVHAYSADGIVPALEALDAEGIPAVLADFEVNSDLYETLILDEQGYYGELQAEYVKNWLAEDPTRVANVGYIVGMYSMEVAMPRMHKFYEGLGSEKAIAEAEASWSADQAMKITEDWIQAHPEINVFACMSDDLAIGCIQALTAAGYNMDDVIVMGIDGTDAAKGYLATGELDMTCANNTDLFVAKTLEIAEKILAGETVEKRIAPQAISMLLKEDFAK